MAKIIDWCTIGETSCISFEQKVVAKIKEGYQPYGNFILLSKEARNQYLLIQSMVKYDAPPSSIIIDFYIIGQSNYDAFDKDVLEKIQEGFEPLGSAVAMRNPTSSNAFDWLILQIMVKYSTPL